jgi:nucleotidyltransferase substrate binding protein (TIGR01987 family)
MNKSVDIRWKQRYAHFAAAYKKLGRAIFAQSADIHNDLYQMALIKAFEMTFELAWKTIKDYLNYEGIDVSLPREVIKQGFLNNIITDGQLWIDMLQERNLMTHTYDEARALQAIHQIIQRYRVGLQQVHQYFQERLA